jgi:hypothetical protein
MKHTRKKVALSRVVMGCLGLFSAPPVQAFSVFGIGAPSSETVASKILETLTKMGGSKFCLKGKNVSPFTIRSFEGYAGKVKILAAAGELACRPKNVPDYLDSHFHKNAVATLGTDDLVKIKNLYSQFDIKLIKSLDRRRYDLSKRCNRCPMGFDQRPF